LKQRSKVFLIQVLVLEETIWLTAQSAESLWRREKEASTSVKAKIVRSYLYDVPLFPVERSWPPRH
jgi:hypothetical protein